MALAEKLLDKITSYDLFNYLLPGILFIYMVNEYTDMYIIALDLSNIVSIGFIGYFVGLVISRLGSLCVSDFLEFVGFISFADYLLFLEASENDPKIAKLSEVNNMYRTFVSLFGSFLVVLLLDKFSISFEHIVLVVSIMMFVLFLFSYRKQTSFIKKRCER